ncbi:transcription factor bHLH52-like [Cornus florida]|uniref:transcription factor bHLH52-like n=1 Tax=Cornus florida TaxID=4283 RepID=UPI0028964357|nr:transcription factor bHLH52-like [Cornus florida]
MALSYCSNWGHLNPDMSVFPQAQPELPIELLGFYDSLEVSDTCIDPFFEHDDQFFYSDETHLLPYLSSPMDHINSLTPELVPLQEFEHYPYPKRQKSYEDCFYSDFVNGFYNGCVPNPCLLSPELFVPLPEFQSPPPLANNCGSSVESVRKPNGGSSTAQSVAARQRRRKITEKTQELGKLIPGGHKMNTAEMFHAAFNYIKYLQAQVGIFESMASFQTNEEPLDTQELQNLVASPLIQEKLYSEEKCLISKQFVETLAHDHGLQSNPMISKNINQLIQTDDGYGIKSEADNGGKF